MDPQSPEPCDATQPTLCAGLILFGRFELQRLLGRGGKGVVWLAHDRLLGEAVALKFLSEVVSGDPAALADLARETRLARQLTHQNIVRIHDLHAGNGLAAIAMEYVDGANVSALRAGRETGRFEPAELGPWLVQLCAAVDHAHRQGVVHRDLKPSNLLITAAGELKVADFGVAASLRESIARVTGSAGSGTPAYMSPQQQAGEAPQPADDWFSVGATVHELLAGRPPDEVFVPTEWKALIARCRSADPRARPRRGSDLLAYLAQSETVTVRLARPRRRLKGWKIGVAATAFALGATLTGWWVTHHETTRGDEVAAPWPVSAETEEIRISSASYPVEGDLHAAIREEFGAGARLADWAAIRQLRSSASSSSLKLPSLASGTVAWIAASGREMPDVESRFVVWPSHEPPLRPVFPLKAVEDGPWSLGVTKLGRWPVVAVVPIGASFREQVGFEGPLPSGWVLLKNGKAAQSAPTGGKLLARVPDGTVELSRPIPATSGGLHSIGLKWRCNLANAPWGMGSRAGLRMRGGGGLNGVAFENSGSGAAAIVLRVGPEGNPVWTRELPGQFGEFECGAWFRDELVHFRVAPVGGGKPLVNETFVLRGVMLAEAANVVFGAHTSTGLEAWIDDVVVEID